MPKFNPAQEPGLQRSGEFMNSDVLSQHPVFLVSADMPGCGASTLAERIGQNVRNLGYPTEVEGVGRKIREELGVGNEDELNKK